MEIKDGDKQQIEALYKQMYRAMIAKDTAMLGSLLDENSVLIHISLITGSHARTRAQNDAW